MLLASDAGCLMLWAQQQLRASCTLDGASATAGLHPARDARRQAALGVAYN